MPRSPQFYLVSPLPAGGMGHFAFTYHADAELKPGQLVQVPFGRRQGLGVVVRPAGRPDFDTKPVGRPLDLPPLPAHLVELAEWLADYYVAAAKAVWQTLLPPGLAAKPRALRRRPVTPLELPGLDLELTDDQKRAIAAVQTGPQTAYLLHGVTGSGKTQVYIELAGAALDSGRSVIVLVPEIALTPQIEARFRARFGDRLITSHSQMTPAARRAAWVRALTADKPQVVVGPRSSLFLPLARPGLIVIDECHETTYKQEQNPRYLADAAAARLAHLTGARLVLGSATPGVGHIFLAEQGRLGLVRLPDRINRLARAKPLVVDLRDQANFGRSRFISRPLVQALTDTLHESRQSLLFINRRGSASSQLCGDCGFVFRCPHCQIALTFHADRAKSVCHYCNFAATPAAVCPECKSANLRFVGGGTKRIEAEMIQLLPGARIARLDRDSATPEYLHQVHRDLHDGRIDILIGTQMIAKGLDLPLMDTIGIVSADTMLHLPDFTAAERTFQLLSQVAGRGGRGDRPGRVIIQTYTPDHPAITAAVAGNFDGFAGRELAQRRLLGDPPHGYLLKLTYAAKRAETARGQAEQLFEQLSRQPTIQVLGPAPAFREIAAGRHHWQIIAKARRRTLLSDIVRRLPSGWTADLDPINLL